MIDLIIQPAHQTTVEERSPVSRRMHWFGSRTGRDHDLLELLEDCQGNKRYKVDFVASKATIVALEATAMKNPIETLFGKYDRSLLGLLLLRPDETFHVRELERITGFPAGTLNRALRKLAQAELLSRKKIGNQIHYQANRGNPIFEELAGLFRKTTGLAGVIGEAIALLDKKIEIALVFGSMASGKQTATSDVDILVVGNLNLKELVAALSPVKEKLGREINPVLMTAKKFFENKRKKSPIVTRILKEPKIFIKGSENELGKLGQDWPTRVP